MNANNGTEKQRAGMTGGKTVDELLIVYANNKHEREEIRMHVHVRLMYKPHKMYGDAMRAMDAMSKSSIKSVNRAFRAHVNMS